MKHISLWTSCTFVDHQSTIYSNLRYVACFLEIVLQTWQCQWQWSASQTTARSFLIENIILDCRLRDSGACIRWNSIATARSSHNCDEPNSVFYCVHKKISWGYVWKSRLTCRTTKTLPLMIWLLLRVLAWQRMKIIAMLTSGRAFSDTTMKDISVDNDCAP